MLSRAKNLLEINTGDLNVKWNFFVPLITDNPPPKKKITGNDGQILAMIETIIGNYTVSQKSRPSSFHHNFVHTLRIQSL